MTAEIAILNAHGVALAADSAVTLSGNRNPKIYNTASKLFALSKYHPVGVMVYADADFMNIPWETVIKHFRHVLGKESCGQLKDYAVRLIEFLRTGPLFPPAVQDAYYGRRITGYFAMIKDEINEAVKNILSKPGTVLSEARISSIVSRHVNDHHAELKGLPRLDTLPSGYEAGVRRKYAQMIRRAANGVFQKLPISEAGYKKLTDIGVWLTSKRKFSSDATGLVIAGFGNDEILPSLVSFRVEAIINGELKYARDRQLDLKSRAAAIVPFAQSDMVSSFMEGIHPSLLQFIDGTISEFLGNVYPEAIARRLSKKGVQGIVGLKADLKAAGKSIVPELMQRLTERRHQEYVTPTLDVVAALPKDELAAMAETLVNLTSFRRKMSREAETVGGPIDVAVISKGDGLVWIKRKHYFSPELNHHFLANYFRV